MRVQSKQNFTAEELVGALKFYANAKGLSTRDLERHLGVYHTSIIRWYNGTYIPKEENQKKIIEFLTYRLSEEDDKTLSIILRGHNEELIKEVEELKNQRENLRMQLAQANDQLVSAKEKLYEEKNKGIFRRIFN